MDHGSGISKENLKMVFQPYFTTKDRGSGKRGFGLGLAICKKIVVLHGGYLNLESEEKKGTTVIVDLPSHVENVVETTKPALLHVQTE
jgi:signal transduction histidine kinase